MYVCGVTGVVALGFKKVHEYDLSTAWNPYSATYNQSLSVSSQEATPQGIFFKDDGTKMFIVGNTGDAVHEYTLSTAWDISSASFVDSTSTSTQTTNPVSLFFKSDGTKLYLVDLFTSQVLQYNLSTAWDASTMAYSNVSFDLDNSINASAAKEISFNPDGTKMWAIFDGGNRIAEFDLSTAWDVSSASYNSVTGLITISEESTPHALFFKSDGSKLYVVGQTNDTVYQYSTLPDTTIDISSGTYFNFTPTANTKFVFSNPPASGTAAGIALALTGANVAEGYDIANASYDNKSYNAATETQSDPRAVTFKPDGTKMYILSATSDKIHQYSLSTAYDVSTTSYDSVEFSVASQEPTPRGMAFNGDGTKFFVVGSGTDSVRQYSMSTAYDISTASYDSVSFSVNQDSLPASIVFNNDGTKFYVAGRLGNIVHQYAMSTAYDLSTASYNSKNFDLSNESGNTLDIRFNGDGSKMYVLKDGTAPADAILQYSLSTYFDVTTASYDSVSFSISSEKTSPLGMSFSNDGGKLFVTGLAPAYTVVQYTTGSTSTATFTYPSSVEFAGGTAPDGPAIGETDVLVFYTDDGGTTYQGFQAGDAMA